MAYKYPDKIPFYKFLLKSSAIAKNPIPFHKQWFDEKDDTFSVKSPLYGHIILTRDSDIARHILQKNHKLYHKSKIQTKFLSKYVGYGLLTSSGEYWLKQRRLIQPAFHKKKIENLVSIIDKAIKTQVDSIQCHKELDLYPIMNELAFEVVAKSLFNYSAKKEILSRLQDIIEKLQVFIVKEIRQPHKKIWYTLKGEIKYHMKLVKESRDIIEAIIDERRHSGESHDDLLDMLLHAQYEDGSSMTNEQLIDEILILFVAGHETTANALTFTFTLLALHPEALNKATSEIKNINTSNPLEALNQLKYIRQCIDESLRLYPPAWITDRVNIEDDTIGNYHLKKGTMLGISIYEMHRNKKYWKHPEAFLPERFNDASKELQKHYMPFGAGPRLCIGNNFALYEMMLTLKAVLEKFEISTSTKKIKLNPLITLKPVDLKLRFEPKN
ncbi:cytochrome P450 [Pontimicrobium sp. IMCC45349]|uniref:cytochrome P450 n=1 Tax=Pontimicrobium sp. IMCC45349 TaxID=3391574 RepID=UPI0039A03703